MEANLNFSLDAQIEEVQREIALRERVYPNLMRTGKMRQSIADYHLNRMRAVLVTLHKLKGPGQNALT